jgi:hypothetical protein
VRPHHKLPDPVRPGGAGDGLVRRAAKQESASAHPSFAGSDKRPPHLLLRGITDRSTDLVVNPRQHIALRVERNRRLEDMRDEQQGSALLTQGHGPPEGGSRCRREIRRKQDLLRHRFSSVYGSIRRDARHPAIDAFGSKRAAGCQAFPPTYGPDSHVTRARTAVFILKALHGGSYVPPHCAGIFADVACPDRFAADWIEDFCNSGVTAGCGAAPLRYCPDSPVSRGQTAVFIARAFALP